MKAIAISAHHGWPRFDGVESYYSLAGRDIERELVPLIVEEGLGLLAYSPQARGLLSGKADLSKPSAIPVERDRVTSCLNAMRGIADVRGVSLSRIAIAWILTKPFVSSVIVGASSKDQLIDNLSAADVLLDSEEIATLDRASELKPEYPAWLEDFANRQRIPREQKSPETLL
jgi:aryl-alcohol dehydrogenase-like predicted oxidoreductase